MWFDRLKEWTSGQNNRPANATSLPDQTAERPAQGKPSDLPYLKFSCLPLTTLRRTPGPVHIHMCRTNWTGDGAKKIDISIQSTALAQRLVYVFIFKSIKFTAQKRINNSTPRHQPNHACPARNLRPCTVVECSLQVLTLPDIRRTGSRFFIL